ncbi:hypothetical protein [Streptomyces antibioticus]|uniref:hypothetical protein n=1 Tax=Streptomyces antibioticus TaxID=1890 RepID=UPI00369D381F
MSKGTGRGLRANALGTFDTVVMAVAGSAPAYSVAATTAALSGVGLGRHRTDDDAASDVRRTWERWFTGRVRGTVAPGALRDGNYLAHAACSARAEDIAGPLLTHLGTRFTRTPWSRTGDPAQQITRWRKEYVRR